MSFNLRLEEGVYDTEMSGVRASLYRDIFEEYPKAAYEPHDIVIDAEKLKKYISDNGFKVKIRNVSRYEDGEERTQILYVNSDWRAALIINQRVYTEKVPDLDDDGEPFSHHRRPNSDPNKFNCISLSARDPKFVEEFKKFIEEIIIVEDTKNKLFMLKTSEYGSLVLDSFPMECSVDLEMNYGEKFQKTHDAILNHLENKKSGLYVFHGPPGTGKTSYIKYLTTILESKRFIFVPNTMLGDIFSPKMVQKLYSFRNSVLVLEDAEICIFKRDGSNNELVSGILNITDGLLKDLLNISIVVTFNSAETRELDPALLRKGRLQIMHKFDLLPMEDAKRLAQKLGMKKSVTTDMSLADVYNLDDDTGVEEVGNKPPVVGFGAR